MGSDTSLQILGLMALAPKPTGGALEDGACGAVPVTVTPAD